MAWNKVKNVALKQLKAQLDEVDGVINQHALFKDFKCQVKKYGPKSLLAMIQEHPEAIDWVFHCMFGCPGSKPPNEGQKHLAAVVCKLLEVLKIEDSVPPRAKQLADDLQLDGSRSGGSSSSGPKTEDWDNVNDEALKQLRTRLDEIEGIIDADADLKSFKYKAKDHPFDLKTMLRHYPERVDVVFSTFRPDRKTKPYPNQVELAKAVVKLLQTMGIAASDQVLAGLAPAVAPAPELDPDLTMRLEEGKRVIYIISVLDHSFWFKLGTHKLDKKAFNPDGPCILDRYSNRPTPPSGMPSDTVWKMDNLCLSTWVYTREELGEAPDDAINKALRKLAGELNIPLAPPGEFHHMGMLCEAVKLVRAAGINAPPQDMVAPEVPVVPEAAVEPVETVPDAPKNLVESIGVQTELVQTPVAPEAAIEPVETAVIAAPDVPSGPSFNDLKMYNLIARTRVWPLIVPSPQAHEKYNKWASIVGRPMLPALPSPSSLPFGIPAVTAKGNQPKRNPGIQLKRKAKGNLQKRKAKGDQQKRKAVDNNNGAIRKFLKTSE